MLATASTTTTRARTMPAAVPAGARHPKAAAAAALGAAGAPLSRRGVAAAARAAPLLCRRRSPLLARALTTAAPPATTVVVEEENENQVQEQALKPSATTPAAQQTSPPLPPVPAPAPPPLLAPPPAAFAAAVDAGAAKAALAAHPSRLLLLSALAGAYIGMGALLALTVGGGCAGFAAQGLPGLQKLIAGLVGLPTGLTLVLCCGGELVTGNLALCTAAALEGRAKWPQVLRAWVLAYAGNIVGALAVVALAAGAGLLTAGAGAGAAAAGPAMAAAAAKCSMPFTVAVFRGILANWLVCLAVWMAVSVRDLPSKFLAALLPVSAFVAMGCEHSVANAFIVPAGLVAGGAGASAWVDFVVLNLVPVTIGNAIGGAVCVAGAYWVAFGGGGGGRQGSAAK